MTRIQLHKIRPFGLLLTAMLFLLAGAVLAQPADPATGELPGVLLPVIFAPGTAEGEISFSSPRFAGVTTFMPQLRLDFSTLHVEPQPVEMKVWYEDEDPAGLDWEPYTLVVDKTFEPAAYGLQHIYVSLRAANGYQHTAVVEFFYIPAGDFAVADRTALAAAGWDLTDGGLPYYVENDTLRLGSQYYGCDNVPYPAYAQASIRLLLPEEGDYHLRLQGTITTYDQLPDPTQAKYDAFEVHLGGNLLGRYGNPNAPLDCSIERKIALDNAYDLQEVSGDLTLQLTNHSRFDDFYNTYTDVAQVWIAAGDPPQTVTEVSVSQSAGGRGCLNCVVGPRVRK